MGYTAERKREEKLSNDSDRALLPKRETHAHLPERPERHQFTARQLEAAKARYTDVDWDKVLSSGKTVKIDDRGWLYVNNLVVPPPVRDPRTHIQREQEWTPEKSKLSNVKLVSTVPEGPGPERPTSWWGYLAALPKEYLWRPIKNWAGTLNTLETQLNVVSVLKYLGAMAAVIPFVAASSGIIAAAGATFAVSLGVYSVGNLISRTLETLHGARPKGENFLSALGKSFVGDLIEAGIQAPFAGTGKLLSFGSSLIGKFAPKGMQFARSVSKSLGNVIDKFLSICPVNRWFADGGRILSALYHPIQKGVSLCTGVLKGLWSCTGRPVIWGLSKLSQFGSFCLQKANNCVPTNLGEKLSSFIPSRIRNSRFSMYLATKPSPLTVVEDGSMKVADVLQPTNRAASMVSVWGQTKLQLMSQNSEWNPNSVINIKKASIEEFNRNPYYAALPPQERGEKLYLYLLQRGLTDEQLAYAGKQSAKTSFWSGIFSPTRFGAHANKIYLRTIAETGAVGLSWALAEKAANNIDVHNTKLFRQIDPNTPVVTHDKFSTLVVAASDSASRAISGLTMGKYPQYVARPKAYKRYGDLCELASRTTKTSGSSPDNAKLNELIEKNIRPLATDLKLDKLSDAEILTQLSHGIKALHQRNPLNYPGWLKTNIENKASEGVKSTITSLVASAPGSSASRTTQLSDIAYLLRTEGLTKDQKQFVQNKLALVRQDFSDLANADDHTTLFELARAQTYFDRKADFENRRNLKSLAPGEKAPTPPTYFASYNTAQSESNIANTLSAFNKAIADANTRDLPPDFMTQYKQLEPSPTTNLGVTWSNNMRDSQGLWGKTKAFFGLGHSVGVPRGFTSEAHFENLKKFCSQHGYSLDDILLTDANGNFLGVGSQLDPRNLEHSRTALQSLAKDLRVAKHSFIHQNGTTAETAARRKIYDDLIKLHELTITTLPTNKTACEQAAAKLAKLGASNVESLHNSRYGTLPNSPATIISNLNEIARAHRHNSWNDFVAAINATRFSIFGSNKPSFFNLTKLRFEKDLTRIQRKYPWLGAKAEDIDISLMQRLHERAVAFTKEKQNSNVDLLKHIRAANDPELNKTFETCFAGLFDRSQKLMSPTDKLSILIAEAESLRDSAEVSLGSVPSFDNKLGNIKTEGIKNSINWLYQRFGWDVPTPALSYASFLKKQAAFDKAVKSFTDSLDSTPPRYLSTKNGAELQKGIYSIRHLDSLSAKLGTDGQIKAFSDKGINLDNYSDELESIISLGKSYAEEQRFFKQTQALQSKM